MPKFIETNCRLVLLFFFTANVCACTFNLHQSIYLFSGTIASTVFRLNLYSDPALKGIFPYYQFAPTKAEVFQGGVYLSQKKLAHLPEDAIIFIDQSISLKDTLNLAKKRLKKKWNVVEVKQQLESPYELSKDALNLLRPYLASTCEKTTQSYMASVETLHRNMISAPAFRNPMIFFMGKWSGKFPEPDALVLGQDGFISYWVDHAKLKTILPTSWRTAPWSAKMVEKKEYIFIGIDSHEKADTTQPKLQKIAAYQWQVTCFACLIPGVLQLEWMEQFVRAAI